MPTEFSLLGKYARAYVDFSYFLILIVLSKGGSCLGLSVTTFKASTLETRFFWNAPQQNFAWL
jgi:hypothetical protein